MDYLVISLVAMLAAGLTLFSGFGLGTLLMPVVALFFPVEIAVGITAVVHLANNVFKAGLLGRQADYSIVLRFGIPAILFAFIGAWILEDLSSSAALFTYEMFGHSLAVTPVKFVVGIVIFGFVLAELSPGFGRAQVSARWLPAGGALSGFFGGLSGHQGALRSMFLIKSGMTAERFVATSVIIAVLVDVARISIYARDARTSDVDWWLVAAATLAAFLGSFLGKRILHKVTIDTVRYMVAALLMLIAIGMLAGFV